MLLGEWTHLRSWLVSVTSVTAVFVGSAQTKPADASRKAFAGSCDSLPLKLRHCLWLMSPWRLGLGALVKSRGPLG